MVYRAAPVTQRDGSELQFANCRPASGSAGIDFHTRGAVTSSGSAMRSRMGDQAGGTSAGDLYQAWRAYEQTLSIVRDGRWDDVIADLRGGRLVMLDIWAASAGGPCLSGAGGYGHSIAVAPERDGSSWLTNDPWCKPAAWKWWPEIKLRAGAQEWGRRVDLETKGPTPDIDDIVRRLMNRWRPDHEARGNDAETGGPITGRVLYTRTAAQTTTGGGGDVGIFLDPRVYDDPGIDYYLDPAFTTKVSSTEIGGLIYQVGFAAAANAKGRDTSIVAIAVSTTKLPEPDSAAPVRSILWAKRADLPDASVFDQAWADAIWGELTTEGGTDEPAPPVEDCTDEIAMAVADRDLEWELALESGQAWPSKEKPPRPR